MKAYRKFSLLIVVTLVLSAFCFTPVTAAPPGDEPVTIEVWFHSGKGEEREVLDAQVEDFNTMQDEVKVEAIRLPEGSYNEQVSAAALAGDLPEPARLRRSVPVQLRLGWLPDPPRSVRDP